MGFEDKYLEILQNIEAMIIHVYRGDSELLDYDVQDAVDALIRLYVAESRQHARPAIRLDVRPQKVFDNVLPVCEWRLGRTEALDEKVKGLKARVISLDEMIQCLKTIQKSIRLWNKERGRRGYLDFVKDYVP